MSQRLPTDRSVIEQVNDLLAWIPQHRTGLDSAGLAALNTVQARLIVIRTTAMQEQGTDLPPPHEPMPQPDRKMQAAHDNTFTL